MVFSCFSTRPEKEEFDIYQYDFFMFDMDGTLIDTSELQVRGWQHALDHHFREQGIDPPTREEILTCLNGNNVYNGLSLLLRQRQSELKPDDFDLGNIANSKSGFSKNATKYKTNYFKTHDQMVRFAYELRIRGKLTAIVSLSRSATQILKKTGLYDIFDIVTDGNITDKFNLQTKPSPDPIDYTISQINKQHGLSIRSEQCVFIGDSIADMTAGNRSACGCVVGFNPENKEKIKRLLTGKGADFVISNPNELIYCFTDQSPIYQGFTTTHCSP